MGQKVEAQRTILLKPVVEDALQEIKPYLHKQRALGSTGFQAMAQARAQHFAGIGPPHRPRSSKCAGQLYLHSIL